MRVLVTGGCGFIGANLAIALDRLDHDVTILDIGREHPLLESFRGTVVHQDASDCAFWCSLAEGYDVVFHHAACTDTTNSDGRYMHDQNVKPLAAILEWAEREGVDVVYASSAAVYGNTTAQQRVGIGERPLNAYGASKLAADRTARHYIERGTSIKIIGLRYFNVYGPGEAHKRMMASMIRQLGRTMRSGRRPRIFADGNQTRDQIHVQDVVRAALLALQAGRDASGIYNVGTGRSVSFNEVVDALNAALGARLEAEYLDNPHTAYQDHTRADITTTTDVLGFRPQLDLEAGIASCLASGAFD